MFALISFSDLFTLTNMIIAVQVVCSAAIILLVLLHSGRGGGVSDMFGGGMEPSAAGSTVYERNLDRITLTIVMIWVFATLTLTIRMQ